MGRQHRYNEVRQKSIHNAYQRVESIGEQIGRWGVRSIELDLHGSGRDWEVYHWLLDSESSIDSLSEGLALLRGIHRADPTHDALTVFLDLKTSFSGQKRRVPKGPKKLRRPTIVGGQYTAQRLDELIRTFLSRKWLYTPGALRSRAPTASTLQEAAMIGSWPTMRELRGKFLFVLTGPRVRLEHYRSALDGPVAFVAPRVDRPRQVESNPEAVMFNLPDGKARRRLGPSLFERGLVTRSYGLDEEKDWRHAVDTKVHHLATDMVDEGRYAWASTREGRLPFQVIG